MAEAAKEEAIAALEAVRDELKSAQSSAQHAHRPPNRPPNRRATPVPAPVGRHRARAQRNVKRVAVLAALSVVTLPIAIVASPGHRSVLLRAELLVLGACGVQAIAALIARAAPPAIRTALEPVRPSRPPRAAPPAGLATLARPVQLAHIHAGDAHHWIGPWCAPSRPTVSHGRGLDLDRPGDTRVAQLLGPVAYPLARAAPDVQTILGRDRPRGPRSGGNRAGGDLVLTIQDVASVAGRILTKVERRSWAS